MSAGPRGLLPVPRPAPAHVTQLAREVLTDVEPLTDRLVQAILAQDTSYREGRTSQDDLRTSCHDNLVRILQQLTGEGPQDDSAFDAPRATGHRRAEQGMPLESVLHAYRLGHRSIWDALVARAREDDRVDGLVEAAGNVWEIVDAFSSVVASAYRETETLIIRRDDRRRDALIDALLEGRGRDRALATAAAAGLDLPEHCSYVVVVLAGHAAGRSAADAFSVRGIRVAWRTRADREIGLVALAPGASQEASRLLATLPGLRAGVSPVVDGLAQVDGAHRQAELALRTLPPGEEALAELDSRLPAALLVTAPDLAQRLLNRALGPVMALPADEREVLLDTLQVWLATGASAGRTADRLYCHRNTVLNRLHRVEALTGRSVERVDHLVELSLALLARELRGDAGAAGT